MRPPRRIFAATPHAATLYLRGIRFPDCCDVHSRDRDYRNKADHLINIDCKNNEANRNSR